mgnify:CR=1 FL=1
MPIRFTALPAEAVASIRGGGPDAYGQPAERRTATGPGLPCRHCLQAIREGREYLTLAFRPFPAAQPYAETGPIFLCADCARAADGPVLPAILSAPDYIIRGYGPDHRILYGTGRVVPTDLIPAAAEALLQDPGVAYVHVRSARNNCYQCRIDRA